MKKISVIFLFAIGLLNVSCDSWLDLKPQSSLTANSMWQSEADAKAALNGAFARFRTAYQNNLIIWGDMRTGFYGNNFANGYVNYGMMWDNQVTPTTNGTNWGALYNNINDLNLILKYVPHIPNMSKSAYDNVIGSAYFLRAFNYFYIAKVWGAAPVVTVPTESDTQEGLYPKRDPVDVVLARVESDLIAAEPLLESSPGSAPFYASLNALYMLETDFYLWQYKVQGVKEALEKAKTAIDKVAGGTNMTVYSKAFDADTDDSCREILFSIPFIQDENTSNFAGNFLLSLVDVSGEYQNNPVPIGGGSWMTFTDEHYAFLHSEPLDTRADVNVQEFVTEKETYRWINKYVGHYTNGTRIFDTDYRIYRWAEANLFRAEIAVEQGDFPTALSELNKVAKRAYGVSKYYDGSYTKDELLKIILEERLKEFASEGKAWFDLIRFGKSFEYIPSLKGRENEKDILLWPVAQETINKNTNIEQTEGYK